MKILVINGPSMNMLGIREKNIYGSKTYEDLVKLIEEYATQKNIEVEVYQSNYEGDIVTKIQKSYGKIDAFIINAAAYTHTSIAILDALKAVDIRTVEVHISAVEKREEFRQISYVGLYAEKTITGRGIAGYIDAIDYLLES